MTERVPEVQGSLSRYRYRWLGIETGPGCPPCNVLTVLHAVVEGRDEWRCPRCGRLR